MHSVAVYQSLILEPDDDRAAALASQILATAAIMRPLPDLTVLVVDDPTTAVRRAETRDGISYTTEQWRLHHRAAAMFECLARADPAHVRLLDRRRHDAAELVDLLCSWTVQPPRRSWARPW